VSSELERAGEVDEMDDDVLSAYARLLVELGANVQEDQILRVRAFIGQERPVRALAAAAYQRGARFVDVAYFDPYLKRARLQHAREETLEFVPSWYGDTLLAASEQRSAFIVLRGPIAPGLFRGLDPARVVRDQLPLLKEGPQVMNARTINTCLAPWPNRPWAKLVHPEFDEHAAARRLTNEIVHMLRLDEPDPIAAWNDRLAALRDACKQLNRQRFDALHLVAPGTDLTIGLFPGSRWVSGDDITVGGIRFVRNLPTEEVFTTPDPARVDGVVRATRPFVFAESQTIVEGLTVSFEDGRAVEVDADQGVDALRTWLSIDEGASRVGEIALVDGSGRIGPMQTAFYDTLIDENAGSHIALGLGFEFALEPADRPRRNHSRVHNDITIGSDQLTVTGSTSDGKHMPIMHGGQWQLEARAPETPR
jgi:aminopeptidase